MITFNDTEKRRAKEWVIIVVKEKILTTKCIVLIPVTIMWKRPPGAGCVAALMVSRRRKPDSVVS
jgi:hypothetical protein